VPEVSGELLECRVALREAEFSERLSWEIAEPREIFLNGRLRLGDRRTVV
jgi:hypothetical protein